MRLHVTSLIQKHSNRLSFQRKCRILIETIKPSAISTLKVDLKQLHQPSTKEGRAPYHKTKNKGFLELLRCLTGQERKKAKWFSKKVNYSFGQQELRSPYYSKYEQSPFLILKTLRLLNRSNHGWQCKTDHFLGLEQ